MESQEILITNWIEKLIKQAKQWLLDAFTSLSGTQRLYLFSALFFVTSLAMSKIEISELAIGAKYASIALIYVAVLNEFLYIFKYLWGSMLGKATILAVYFIITNIFLAASSVAINDLIKTDVVTLTYTQNIIAISLIPSALILASAILSILGMVLYQFYLFITIDKSLGLKTFFGYKNNIPGERFPVLTFVFRIIALSVIYTVSTNTLEAVNKGANQFIQDEVSSFIYTFEGKKYTRCTLNEDQRAVKGDDNQYLIITKTEKTYDF
jgi:hypothetical protein